MRKLLFLLLILAWPLFAADSPRRDSVSITTSGTSQLLANSTGGLTATFEEIPVGGPASVSVTVAGCMKGGTCDSAADTNTSTSAAIRSVAFTKVYDYFKITASWTGGSSAYINVNATVTTAKTASSGGTWGSITGTLSAQSDLNTALSAKAPLDSPTFTGTPSAPTPDVMTNTTQLATTAMVHSVFPGTPWQSLRVQGTNVAGLITTSANRVFLFGEALDYPITVSNLAYEVGTTADNTSATYDFGVYTGTSGGTCTLVANIGSTAGTTATPATSTIKSFALTQGTVTIPAGRVYLATTTSQSGTAATLFGSSAAARVYAIGSVAISAGGTLPGTTTCPTDANSGAGTGPAGTSMPWFSLW